MFKIEEVLGSVSYQDRERILSSLLWYLFGDMTDPSILTDGELRPEVTVESVAELLRDEFWPDHGSDGAEDEDQRSADYEHDSLMECMEAGDHLEECDEHGFCVACGHQDSNAA